MKYFILLFVFASCASSKKDYCEQNKVSIEKCDLAWDLKTKREREVYRDLKLYNINK